MNARAVFAAFAALSMASTAVAQPTAWDRVRDPALGTAEEVLELALRARLPREAGDERPALSRLYALRAATLVEMAGGQSLASNELQLFLGDSLIAADAGRDKEGRRILRRALVADPDAPLAARSWFAVAIASNRLRDYRSERDAYAEALRVEWSREARARIFMNRGEASMSLGDLVSAKQDYQTALDTSSDSEVYALANWGLAVALARESDLPRALERVRDAAAILFPSPKARGERIQAIELPTVFFTPEYEIHYYRALASMGAAERAQRELDRIRMLERAVIAWKHYLSRAVENEDRWIANVELYRDWCVERLRDARARLKQPSNAQRRRGRAGSD